MVEILCGENKKSWQKLFFKLFRFLKRNEQKQTQTNKNKQKEWKRLNYHEKHKDFYNSSDWKALRNYKFGMADGLCENCKKKGIVRAGREVHHIIPIEQDYSKRLDIDNLVLLCPSCHQEMHNRDSQLQKFLREWENIWCVF